MLAQLKSIPGVAEARVEASGQYFMLECKPGTDISEITPAALAILGEAVPVPAPGTIEPGSGECVDGEIWFNSGTLISLSLLEARILARQWGGAAVAHAGLSPESADRFLRILYRELAGEFKALHEKGGTGNAGWYLSRFPAAFDRALAGFGSAADPDQACALRESLHRSLGI